MILVSRVLCQTTACKTGGKKEKERKTWWSSSAAQGKPKKDLPLERPFENDEKGKEKRKTRQGIDLQHSFTGGERVRAA